MKLFNADTIYQIFPQNYSKVRIPKILQNYPFPFDLIFARKNVTFKKPSFLRKPDPPKQQVTSIPKSTSVGVNAFLEASARWRGGQSVEKRKKTGSCNRETRYTVDSRPDIDLLHCEVKERSH